MPFGRADVNIATVDNNLRFAGQYYDSETGLHYNYFRYYDPSIGRYLTPDPVGLDGGLNLYTYVADNPINFIDPSGLFKLIPFGRGVPGLDEEGRGFENAVKNIAIVTIKEADKCLEATVTCMLREVMPSAAVDAAMKKAMKETAKTLAMAGLKAGAGKITKYAIPIYGQISTGITILKYADCFGEVIRRN